MSAITFAKKHLNNARFPSERTRKTQLWDVSGILKNRSLLKDFLLSDKIIHIDLRANFQLALKCLTLKDFIFCDITASFRPLFS